MYLKIPKDIVPQTTTKRKVEYVTVTRRILTITLRSLQKKILEKMGEEISLGTIFHYKPFFISYATEKEKILCMCILCLNIREQFDSLMKYIRTLDRSHPVFTSITSYFMQGCNCEWGESGTWEKNCCLGKCKNCKKSLILPAVVVVVVVVSLSLLTAKSVKS